MDMISLTAFKHWNEQLSQYLHRNAEDEDASWLIEEIYSLVKCQKVQIIAYQNFKPPQLVSEISHKNYAGLRLNDSYIEGTYLLDPFYRAAIQHDRTGLLHLKEVAPEGFVTSEYYQNYYKKKHMADEACILCHMGGGIILLSCVCFSGETHLGKQELDILDAITPVVQQILARLWHQKFISSNKGTEATLKIYLETALNNFGTSVLTKRESEIVRLMLQGHSIKSLAYSLDISIDTVKHHRKNIYHKLEISTLTELFNLFITSMKTYDPDLSADPLVRTSDPKFIF